MCRIHNKSSNFIPNTNPQETSPRQSKNWSKASRRAISSRRCLESGSGKTFTMANVIQQLNKPTLIIAHNKTLAAQLYGEMKEFFPHNAVEYFVS